MLLEELMKIAIYSTLTVCKILDMDRERFRPWLLNDYFQPTLASSGRGSKVGFSLSDVYGIALFKLLVDMGIKREIVSNLGFTELIGSIVPGMSPESGGIFGNSTYFIFGCCIVDGEKEYFSSFLVDKNETNKMVVVFSQDELQINSQEPKQIGNWDYINTVNLAQLRQGVDKAIAELT